MTPKTARLLVVCEVAADSAVICRTLETEFRSVKPVANLDGLSEEFDREQPDVLVLALPSVAQAEQCYLALYRRSRTIAAKPHRTVLLCNKNDVRAAYELCRRACFDDYVLYWPATFDQPRLAMSVHHALRSLAAATQRSNDRKLEMLSSELSEVEPLVESAITEGARCITAAGEALHRFGDGFGRAVEDLSADVTKRLGAMNVGAASIGEVSHALRRLNDEHVARGIRAVEQSLAPARESLARSASALRPRLSSARKLATELASGSPTILVVEDEETQRKIYRHLLESARYRVAFAETGAEALRMIAAQPPDLILMDIMLPDLDGVEVTRLLKASPSANQIPVVVITGHSEREVVMQSVEAGAVDFLVKPFTPASLAQKVTQHLGHVRARGEAAAGGP
jgi:CheY-like chemotaxis protein